MNNRYEVHLESDRLLLRNMKSTDSKFFIDLWTNPDVTEFMGGPRDKGKMLDAVKEVLDDPYLEEYDLWILTEKESNQPIGHCGLLSKSVEGRDEVEVIYVIDKPYWGKGYASEICKMLISYAFEDKKLNRVIALINPKNKGSESVALKNGMNLEKEVLRDDKKMLLYVKEQ